MKQIAIVDYGLNNLLSLSKVLGEVGAVPSALNHPKGLDNFDALILPGVGNFEASLRALLESGWLDAIHRFFFESCRPVLGICLGMQLLSFGSTEGYLGELDDPLPGLQLIPGIVEHLGKFRDAQRFPHVGWNSVIHDGDPLFDGIPSGSDFYFVHSYALPQSIDSAVVATCEYGIPFAAAVRKGQALGVQFHPEKSSLAGRKLLSNFVEQI